MDRVNLHIYPSPFTHESRIQKETKSIADADLADQIFMVGVWEDGLPEIQRFDEKRQVWRVKPKLGSQQSGVLIKTLRYIEWQLKIYSRFRNCRVTMVNCHSLPVLPLGALFKLLKKVTLIYDTHELETEGAGSVGIKRLLYNGVEALFIHFADAVITVNESISEWYRKTYKLDRVATVRNIPPQPDLDSSTNGGIFKQKFGISDQDILYIFQGNFGPGRGIQILLDVFSKVDPHKHVVFMGFGDLEETILSYEKRFANIHFQPAVSPQEIIKYTRGADIGLCLQENIGLNYYLSLPNKLFEYIMSGVPAIVSDFPEMARVINEGKCGWKVPVKQEDLYQLVQQISIGDIHEKQRNALEYRKSLGWHVEERSLLAVYNDLKIGGNTR